MSLSSPQELSELYATVTRHLLLRQYPAACASVQRLLDLVEPEAGSSSPRSTSGLSEASTADVLGASTSSSSWSDAGASRWSLPERWSSTPPVTLRAVKLAITVYISVFLTSRDQSGKSTTDPQFESLPLDVSHLIGPTATSARPLICHLLDISLHHLSPLSHASRNTSTSSTEAFHHHDLTPIPPSIINTLVLACLKLDTPDAILTVRDVVETWLSQIPDEVIHLWSTGSGSAVRSSQRKPADLSASEISSTDSETSGSSPSKSTAGSGSAARMDHRADYHKLVELYVLEILPREGDWDIAMDYLSNDSSLGSKRKEFMLRRLHAIKAKSLERAAATSSPTIAQPRSDAHRESTAESSASSESELTARPPDKQRPFMAPSGSSKRQMGMSKEMEGARRRDRKADDGTTTPRASSSREAGHSGSSVSSEEGVAHAETTGKREDSKASFTPQRRSSEPPALTGFAAFRARLADYILNGNARSARDESNLRGRRAASPARTTLTSRLAGRGRALLAVLSSKSFASLFLVLAIILFVRRAVLRRRLAVVTPSPPSATNDVAAVQERIRQKLARQTEWRAWVMGWIWLILRKLNETVVMGTKITYV